MSFKYIYDVYIEKIPYCGHFVCLFHDYLKNEVTDFNEGPRFWEEIEMEAHLFILWFWWNFKNRERGFSVLIIKYLRGWSARNSPTPKWQIIFDEEELPGILSVPFFKVFHCRILTRLFIIPMFVSSGYFSSDIFVSGKYVRFTGTKH